MKNSLFLFGLILQPKNEKVLSLTKQCSSNEILKVCLEVPMKLCKDIISKQNGKNYKNKNLASKSVSLNGIQSNSFKTFSSWRLEIFISRAFFSVHEFWNHKYLFYF